MANHSVSKNSPRLNLTQQQIYIFRETVNLGDRLATFLNSMSSPEQIVYFDFKTALELTKQWGTFRSIFVGKTTCILGCICSLERACEEYSKIVAGVDNLNARVTMASMVDRVRQDVNHLMNLLVNP